MEAGDEKDEAKEIVSKYRDPRFPTALGGVEAFSKRIRKSKEKVKDVLSGFPGYSRHVPVRKNFPRGRIFTTGPYHQFHADLMDMSQYAGDNDGYKYVFVCIDAFSKKCWVRVMKSKTAESAVKVFSDVLKTLPMLPHSFYSDQGSEFKGAFKTFLTSKNIKQQMSKDKDIKSAIAERVIRTLKGKLFRYFTIENTRRYVDVLQDVCSNYNKSFNSAIGAAPDDVGFHNVKTVFDRLYMGKRGARYPGIGFTRKSKKHKFKVSDHVRIKKSKSPFEKGYTPTTSEEIFQIKTVVNRNPVVYRIVDMNREDIVGTFYEQELIPAKPPSDDDLYLIDKILKTRKVRGGKKEYFVSYVGWPKSFNSWIPETDVVNL